MQKRPSTAHIGGRFNALFGQTKLGLSVLKRHHVARLPNDPAISFGSELPRPHEIVLWIGYATGPRVNARCKGPDQTECESSR